MIQITNDADLFELEPMKYWSMSSTYSREVRQEKLDMLVASKQYITSQKVDGNLVRAVITPERFALQTRGRGVNSGDFGEIQDKVLWANDIANAFEGTTVLLGEAYIIGGTDKTVGAVLRSLPKKALERQKTEENIVRYYIFDCLAYNGEYFFDKPITERIKYLKEIVENINSPYISYAKYYEVDEKFYDRLANILANGGEGTVLYKKTMLPCEGRTKAWDTVKVKQELKETVDAFITGIEPCKMEYTGKEPNGWPYWYDTKRDRLLPIGNHFPEYANGMPLMPVTKSYYNNLPGAIICSVFNDNNEEQVLCKCANLTDELSIDLRDNFNKYDHTCCRIDGMLVSNDRFGNISIRHPKLVDIRDDIDITDCTLNKIIGE